MGQLSICHSLELGKYLYLISKFIDVIDKKPIRRTNFQIFIIKSLLWSEYNRIK